MSERRGGNLGKAKLRLEQEEEEGEEKEGWRELGESASLTRSHEVQSVVHVEGRHRGNGRYGGKERELSERRGWCVPIREADEGGWCVRESQRGERRESTPRRSPLHSRPQNIRSC